MSTFLEGVDVVRQPCTLAMVVPALVVAAVAGRRAPGAVTGFVLGAAVLAWAQAARLWEVGSDGAPSVVAGGVVVLAIVTLIGPGDRLADLAIGAGGVVGAIAGWLWRPCVGPRLADVLNQAPDEGARTLVLMTVYVAGAVLPALILAVAPVAWPRLFPAQIRKGLAGAGAIVGLTWAAAVVVGRYDDLVAELLARSQA